MKKLFCNGVLAVGMIVLCLGVSFSQTKKLRLIDLSLPGEPSTFATALNNASQVIITSQGGPFLWQNGVRAPIPGLPFPTAINDSGWIAGYGYTGTAVEALVWKHGIVTIIGGISEQAFAINNAGQVCGVGKVTLNDTIRQGGFFWDGANVTPLPFPTGWNRITNCNPMVMNGQGDMVGSTGLSGSSLSAPLLWHQGNVSVLNYSGGAVDINDSGYVCGFKSDGVTETGLVWHNGQITTINPVSGLWFSPVKINNRNQVVGYDNRAGFGYGTLWENGTTYDIDSLIVNLGDMIKFVPLAINDSGMIAGVGYFSNNKVHAILLQPYDKPYVEKPQAGEIWIAGVQDTIRWRAPGIDSVTISLSTDYQNGAGTFEDIAVNIPADSGIYVWSIPDSLLSRKCVIAIRDASNINTYVESGSFKIKPYVMTRVNQNGDYERFDPTHDWWLSNNTTSNMWPSSWYSQFNYSSGGIDPYTNTSYLYGAFSVASSSDFPDWPLFVRTFGVNQCYYSLNPPSYKFSALRKWWAIKSVWGGSCAGFALSSILAFQNKLGFTGVFPEMPPFTDLSQFSPVSDSTREVINNLWEHQFGVQHQTFQSAAFYSKTPAQTLEDIKRSLGGDGQDYSYLYLAGGGINGGAHAVVPYKLQSVNFGLFGPRSAVYVYDSNYPLDSTGYVYIDSASHGGQGSWFFTGLPWNGTNALFLMDPANSYLNQPILGSAEPKAGRLTASVQQGQNLWSIYPSSSAFVDIANDSEQTIGWADSTLPNTIPGAVPLTEPTGHPGSPYCYLLPRERYSVILNKFKDSTSHLFVFGDSTIFDYERKDAAINQIDKVSFDGTGMAFKNTDTSGKNIDFHMVIVETNQEKLFHISNNLISSGDSLSYHQFNHGQLQIANAGGQEVYNLDIELANTSGNPSFIHSSIRLAGNSTHDIVPNWADLTAPVKIYIDLGNDGTIDDSILVDNQITLVRDRVNSNVPKIFALYQNYPNPFNPVTTISFDLPKQSFVTLTVYNMLGQEVATLVSGVRQAGRYSVPLDATRQPSGVYFYRIEATNISDLGKTFTQVRKMVLVK